MFLLTAHTSLLACIPSWCTQKKAIISRTQTSSRNFHIQQAIKMEDDFAELKPLSPGESLEHWLKRDLEMMTDEYEASDSNPSPLKKAKLELDQSSASSKEAEDDVDAEDEDEAVDNHSDDEEDETNDGEDADEDEEDEDEDEFNDDDYSADENDGEFGLPSKPSITTQPTQHTQRTGLPAEQHIPGVNDMMSGGLGGSPSPKPRSRSRSASVDHIVTSSSIDRATKMPPFRILSRKEIVKLGLFVGDVPVSYEADMIITVLGARRALDEVQQALGGREEKGYDELLMEAMMKRMGKFVEEVDGDDDKIPAVPHAEDLFPLGEELDEGYWQLVYKERELWRKAGVK
jgi:hypothetical protein